MLHPVNSYVYDCECFAESVPIVLTHDQTYVKIIIMIVSNELVNQLIGHSNIDLSKSQRRG